jgi:signal transduction histidine kinase
MAILKGNDFTVEIANDKMYELWGRDAAQLINRPIFEGLPEAAGQGLEELLQQVFASGEPYYGKEVPIRLPRNSGIEIAYINFVYQAYKQPGGNISGVMVLGTDVTDQVQARNAVEKSQQELQVTTNRLQLAIEVGGLGTYELDMEKDELVTSPRFNEIFDVHENTLRQHYLDIIHPEDRSLRDEAHRLSRETGILNYTVRLLGKNNHIKWVRIRGILNFDHLHNPVRIMGIVQDITDAKELEFQKDSFLGIASHELKTPVTSIKSYVQLMETMLKKEGLQKYAEMMGRIDKQVNRLNFLISDLLDVTKINSGKLQLNISSFDFDQLVKEVTEDIQRVSAKHEIKTELKCDAAIMADRERVIQVVTNLINNAVKYSPDAESINIYTSCDKGEVMLCVQDYGIGIAEEKQEKVFEQFYRVSGTKEHTFPGLGLGLYISAEIIKRMGGRIWVSSVKDQGSTFCFAFPIKSAD